VLYIQVPYDLQQRFDLNLCDCPQDSTVEGTSDEALLRQRLLGKLPTEKWSCLKPDKVTTSRAGEIKLLEDGGAKVEMPLLQTGSSRTRDLQDSAHCIQLLGRRKVDFQFGLTAGSAEPECSFQICKRHVEKLPLLRNLMTITSDASRDVSKETPENVCQVAFEPPHPAGASLVCDWYATGMRFDVAGENSITKAALRCLSLWSKTCHPVSVGRGSPRLAMLCANAVPFARALCSVLSVN
jgi:hypothetical protein